MWLRFAGLAAAVTLTVACSFNVAGSGAGQDPTYRAPRTPDHTPNLSGIWQANNTANWDLEPHEARMGPVVALAAAFSVPPGLGVVEGDEITCQLRSEAQRHAPTGEARPEVGFIRDPARDLQSILRRAKRNNVSSLRVHHSTARAHEHDERARRRR